MGCISSKKASANVVPATSPNRKDSAASNLRSGLVGFVRGLKGNAKFLLPKHRNGILIHTGEWQNYSNWKAPEPMPNSAGCVHTWENYVAKIWKLNCGVCGVCIEVEIIPCLPNAPWRS